MTQQPQDRKYKIPGWLRVLIYTVAFLLLVLGVLWLLNTLGLIPNPWSDKVTKTIMPIFGLLSLIIGGIFALLSAIIVGIVSNKETLQPFLQKWHKTPDDEKKATEQSDPTSAIAPPLATTQATPQLSGPIFYFNVPHLPNPDALYGRRRERTTLLDRTSKGLSTSIIGPRRIGKTWLVDYLRLVTPTELGNNFHIASLDGTMPNCTTVSAFTAKALDAFGIPLLSDTTNMNVAMLGQFVTDQKAKNIIPVLCIDEFEGFSNQQGFDCDFFANMRYIAQNNGLVLVIVSKGPLIDLVGHRCQTSGFFNIFEQLTLKPFNQAEAEEFAHAKSTQAGFTDDERDILLKYGQDRKGQQQWPPLRLQLAGKMLLEDKTLAAGGNPHYYRPHDVDYWDEFKERLEEKYRGVVR